MTKLRILFVCLIVILSILTFGVVNAEESIKVLFTESPRDTAIIRIAIPEFEKATGVKVESELCPTNAQHERMVLEFNEKSSRYDVVTFPDEWATEFVVNKWIYPMDQFIKNPTALAKDQLGIMLKDPDFTNIYHKKIYSLPYTPGSPIIFYRKDIFEQENIKIPQTLTELIQVAKKLTRPEKELWGISMAYSTKGNQLIGNFLSLIPCFNGTTFDKKWNPTFHKEAGVRTANYIRDMLKYNPPGALTNDYFEALTDFAQGKTAMLMLWSHAIINIEDPEQSRIIGKVGSFPIPKELKHGGLQADWYFGINAFSKKKQLAAKFIQFVNDTKMVKRLWLEGKVPPARISVANDPEVSKTFYIGPTIVEQYKYTTGYPRITVYEFFAQRMINALSAICTQNVDTKQTLSEVAEEMRQELKRAGYIK